ncbi:MAG: pyruvate formate lyase activating enzyme [Clostridia bacterium]|jgi:pyruvate formate lyase activating enzyme|nr:PflA [Clostridiales bacterium]MDK2985285.1 pyruvate formate lyase activating enzyme [Clostridia bacterium]
MQRAQRWDYKKDDVVECYLCPHHCTIREGRAGRCRVRVNNSGTLYSENYGRITAINVDPIEKKPLYHFYPGSSLLSLGTFGCNFHCSFCQNWQIAHGEPVAKEMTPQEVVELAVRAQKRDGSIGIAYTYSEPLMWFEFVKDVAPRVKEKGQENILVTNGFIEDGPLNELLPYISALNIDVKGFTSEFYRKTVKGDYKPVLRTAEISKKSGCHVEITTLLIPGLNDSSEEIEDLTSWVAYSLGKDTPLHFSRYFPNYKMDLEPTPLETMERAREIALQKLDYVYLGNVPGTRWSNTYCPGCGKILIERHFYSTRVYVDKDAKCKECGKEVNIIM